MRKNSLGKLGLATLIAASSLLATKPVQAAGLCVFSYMHHGRTCTFVDSSNGCCHYIDQNGATCPPICGV
jgi:hypothetical protein